MFHERDLIFPEINPDGWDYLPLMGAVHVPLATLSLALQGLIFTFMETQKTHLSTPEMWGIIIGGHSLNMLMELYTLSKYDATANIWAMTLSQAGKVPDWISVLFTYAVNTTFQTLSSPVNMATLSIMSLGGDNRVISGFTSQSLAGMLCTGVATGLIISGTLEPVAGLIHKGRTSAATLLNRTIDRTSEFLDRHAEDIKRLGR